VSKRGLYTGIEAKKRRIYSHLSGKVPKQNQERTCLGWAPAALLEIATRFLRESPLTSFKGRLSLSGRTLLPLLIRDCQDFSGPPVCCAPRRILGGRQKNRPVVTPHADVTSNQPEQE